VQDVKTLNTVSGFMSELRADPEYESLFCDAAAVPDVLKSNIADGVVLAQRLSNVGRADRLRRSRKKKAKGK